MRLRKSFKGIKFRYPNLKFLPVKLRGVIQLVRPLTLIPPLIAGYIATILPCKTLLSAQAFLVALSLALAQAFGQATNQVTGLYEDMYNKKYRPLPSGILSVEEAIFISSIIAGLSIFFAIISDFLLWVVIFFAAGLSYNFRIKYTNQWVSLFWLALSRGYLPFIACYSVFGSIFDAQANAIAIILFLWVFAFQATKDFPDVEGDKKFNIKTLPTVYGIEGAKRIIKILATLPFVATAVAICSGILSIFYALFFVVALVAIYNIHNISTTSVHFENTRAWIGFYGGLGLFYIIMFVVEVMI